MRSLIIVLLALVGTSCMSFAPAEQDLQPDPDLDPFAEPELADTYRIGVGDILSVSVWGNPDLTLTVPVRPDGFITLPLVGDIIAQEITPESLAENITSQLSEQVRNPQVTVIVAQVNSTEYISRVRVTGAVRAPRSLVYARGMSVLDAILEAGGVNELASANRAKLYRQTNGRLVELEVRLDDILLRGRLETNYPLWPGDVLTVPERLF